MLSYLEDDVYLSTIFNSQLEHQERMVESSDYIYHDGGGQEDIKLDGLYAEKTNVSVTKVVTDKQCNRAFILTKYNWENLK